MPPLFMMGTAILVLASPIYGLIVILFNTRQRPHHRSILALGGGVLLKIFIMSLLAMVGFMIEGNPNPILSLVFFWLAGIVVYHLMNTAVLRS